MMVLMMIVWDEEQYSIYTLNHYHMFKGLV